MALHESEMSTLLEQKTLQSYSKLFRLVGLSLGAVRDVGLKRDMTTSLGECPVLLARSSFAKCFREN